MSLQMTIRPRVSEKAYGLSQLHNTYVFVVPKDANKVTIAEGITSQFKVTVLKVTVMNIIGKNKRTVRKGGRPTIGKRSDYKKAYVTLKAGDSIPIFATEEAEVEATKTKKGKK